MRFAYCITKATDTHSECVTLFIFPLQQWLYEHVSVLRYTYIAYIVVVQLGRFRVRIVQVHLCLFHRSYYYSSLIALMKEPVLRSQYSN